MLSCSWLLLGWGKKLKAVIVRASHSPRARNVGRDDCRGNQRVLVGGDFLAGPRQRVLPILFGPFAGEGTEVGAEHHQRQTLTELVRPLQRDDALTLEEDVRQRAAEG